MSKQESANAFDAGSALYFSLLHRAQMSCPRASATAKFFDALRQLQRSLEVTGVIALLQQDALRTEPLIDFTVRLQDGTTPLMKMIASPRLFQTMDGLTWTYLAKLIQSGGVDVNAQDKEGDTILHQLSSTCIVAILHQLAERGLLGLFDLFAVNAKGETPLQLVQQLTLVHTGNSAVEQMHQTISLLVSLWRRDVRPLLMHLVKAHLALIHDLADLVLEFVDGGGSAPARA